MYIYIYIYIYDSPPVINSNSSLHLALLCHRLTSTKQHNNDLATYYAPYYCSHGNRHHLDSTSRDAYLFVCLFLFYALAISKVISGRVLTCNSRHSWRLYSAAPLSVGMLFSTITSL